MKMPIPPPSRDRLARPVDISTLLPGATRRVNLMVDEPGLRRFGLSWNGGSRNVTRNGSIGDGGSVVRTVGVLRTGIRRGRNQQRARVIGREMRALGSTATRGGGGDGGGQGRRSVLPSWYPRTPFQDITGIVRAIDQRRAVLGLNQDGERQQQESNAAVASVNAQLELEIGASTPIPTIALKPEPSPATQLLWRIKPGNLNVDGSDFVTPQKKLLNSIEKVREVWLEEQQKLKRTPAAKRAERERKVRVLMSMR